MMSLNTFDTLSTAISIAVYKSLSFVLLTTVSKFAIFNVNSKETLLSHVFLSEK